MNSHRNLAMTNGSLNVTLERLSSGLRVNRAADDAGGLAISEKLRAQVSGLEVAVSNAQDGISLIQTAEGALDRTHAILRRIRDLTEMAANGDKTDGDREHYQAEVEALLTEIDRIAETTEYNTLKLLNGTVGGKAEEKADTDGINNDAKLVVDGQIRTTGEYKVSIYNAAERAKGIIVGNVAAAAAPGVNDEGGFSTLMGQADGDYAFKIESEGQIALVTVIAEENAGDNISDVLRKFNEGMAAAGIDATASYDPSGAAAYGNGTASIIIQANEYGSKHDIHLELASAPQAGTITEPEFVWASGGVGMTIPYWTAVDSSGNVYTTDYGNFRVQQFNSAGVYQSQFGSFGAGNGQFNRPLGIAINSAGDIYVSDQSNFRVQIFNSAGVYQSQFGSAGAGDGQFGGSGPYNMAFDSAGNIYVTDNANSRIQKFNSAGGYLDQFAVIGNPTSVHVDSADNIFVADIGNNRIQKYDSGGNFLFQFGSGGAGAGQFDQPWDVTTDTAGNIYVADTFNSRVQKFDSTGTYVSEVGAGLLTNPTGVEFDDSGNLYVTEWGSGEVSKFSTGGGGVTIYNSDLTDTDGKLDSETKLSGGSIDDLGLLQAVSTGTFAVVTRDGTRNIVNVVSMVATTAAATIDDLLTRLNDVTNVSATYDESTGAFSLTDTSSGTGNFQVLNGNDEDYGLTDLIGLYRAEFGDTIEGVRISRTEDYVLRVTDPGLNEAFLRANQGDRSSYFAAQNSSMTLLSSGVDPDYAGEIEAGAGGIAGVSFTLEEIQMKELGVDAFSILASAGSLTLQIGQNKGGEHRTTMTIDDMSVTGIGLTNDLDVSTQGAAMDLIDSGMVDTAINRVSKQRGVLGAFQNRLEHTIKNLGVTEENLQSSESRIRDADMADEMMEFTKNQIMMQAGTAMLAQANQIPQNVLQLLG